MKKFQPYKRILSIGIIVMVLLTSYSLLSEPSPPTVMLGVTPEPLDSVDTVGGGVALAINNTDPGIGDIGAQWYFNWHYKPHEGINIEFVPLVFGYPGNRQVSDAHVQEIEAEIINNPAVYPDGTLFLVGNEIGYKHQKDGRNPRDYAKDFHRCYTLLKSINPSYQVSVGPIILTTDKSITNAIVDAEDGLDYLRQVIVAYQELYGELIPAEFFAATNHVTSANEEGFRTFQQRIIDLRSLLMEANLRDRSVILTEFGVPVRGPTAEQIESFMKNSIHFVATATDTEIGHPSDGKLIQRWAWFITQPLSPIDKISSTGTGAFFLRLAQTSLYDQDGNLTHLGQVYRTMLIKGATR